MGGFMVGIYIPIVTLATTTFSVIHTKQIQYDQHYYSAQDKNCKIPAVTVLTITSLVVS